MTGGNGNMQCVISCLCGQRSRLQKHFRQGQGFGRRFQQDHGRQDRKLILSGLRIARPSFPKDQLRSTKFITSPASVPPFMRNLLMPRDDHITTGPSSQITDERRFDVDSLR
ncbi:MAG TPA: hypothetical protein VKA46_39475, partial [Gemmataceae bacterium]|nr:hypothetical protein [Gemmataceae bacterium]